MSINLILGDNGIISKAKGAKSTYEEEAVKEKLTLILAEYPIVEDEPEESFDDFLNRKKEEGQFEDVINNGDGTHTIIIDGYKITIKDEDLTILETEKETWFKRLTRGKAKFVYKIEEEYVANVDVTIEIDESIKMYTTQYKIGDEEDSVWVDYTEGEIIKVIKNGTIYGRIVHPETGEVGYEFKSVIGEIETIPPKNAIITFNATSVDTGGTIQATVTHEDLETGIEIEKCKYIIDTTAAKYGTDSTKWSSAIAFASNPQVINITQSAVNYYYVHVLSCDKAGNMSEEVSTPIYFRNWITLFAAKPGNMTTYCTEDATFNNAWRLQNMQGVYGAKWPGFVVQGRSNGLGLVKIFD